ncbi:rRNA-processing protein RRP17 [Aspergillus affinis]|uniref:rRNA-processing protein RRP17 n=1 Tax=Aspergillus affinis TaxID=1070780 RepID=UPI0022FE292B|nr:uncharacterized protein KD926_005761 [Aspergillus affinis]KAI9042261.1 hypothetical protein KD926_005761 [Aspergillus affinis]
MGPVAKRRKVQSKTEEINFDPDARHSFLTGFRKRKQQRVKHAQEVAEQKYKEAQREQRKRIRQERTEGFQRAIEEHRKQLKKINDENRGSDESESGSDDEEENQEWEGFAEPPAVDYEAEYIDEDKYTTVTVEEMDPSREGLLKSQKDDDSSEADEQTEAAPEAEIKQSAEPTKKRISDNKAPKKKKKKFRYESKEDRKLTRAKQRQSNHKKAQARRERG